MTVIVRYHDYVQMMARPTVCEACSPVGAALDRFRHVSYLVGVTMFFVSESVSDSTLSKTAEVTFQLFKKHTISKLDGTATTLTSYDITTLGHHKS